MAAKAAALLDIQTEDLARNSDTAELKGKQGQAKKVRRRKRHKRTWKRHTSEPEAINQSTEDEVEYVPEPIAALGDSQMQQSGDEKHALDADDIDNIVSTMQRFMQRGVPQNDEEETITHEGVEDLPESGDNTNKTAGHKEDRVEDEIGEASETPDDKGTGTKPLSRKKQKETRRYQVSLLKSWTERPEVVDAWDVTAPDPFLLVKLKTWPNAVQVPINWRQKRKYLQNKRGMEKKPFQLPAYIVDTGVGEMRSAQIEADQKKTLKQRQREKMRAKTGRGVEIDHSRLRDAFFKYQTKPRLTKHGDVYYELRELEVDGSQFKPGVLSEELRAALAVSEGDPPLWLVNMQRYGPPPGYPGLKIPGVNAPIPPGARYGYHIGGWGKPPVDEYGRPIYGDVFGEGIDFGNHDKRFDLNDNEKKQLWGEIRKPGSKVTVAVGVQENSEDEDTDDESQANEDEGQQKKPSQKESNVQRDSSRKEHIEKETIRPKMAETGSLYKILQQKKSSVGQNSMLGSSHVYEMPDKDNNKGNASARKDKGGDKRERDGGDERREAQVKRSKFKF